MATARKGAREKGEEGEEEEKGRSAAVGRQAVCLLCCLRCPAPLRRCAGLSLWSKSRLCEGARGKREEGFAETRVGKKRAGRRARARGRVKSTFHAAGPAPAGPSAGQVAVGSLVGRPAGSAARSMGEGQREQQAQGERRGQASLYLRAI